MTDKDLSTIAELEKELQLRPHDPEAMRSLAEALLYHYEDTGDKKDIDRLKQVLSILPEDQGNFERGYIAWLEAKDEADDFKAVDYLSRAALEVSEEREEPFNCDELFWLWVNPFRLAAPERLWARLAESFSVNWPDSAAVLTLRGFEEVESTSAVDYFARALERDHEYWLAAWECAGRYMLEKNWRAARGYFQRALSSEGAKELADIRFGLALCYGKIKDYQEEANAYLACLELDPDYPYARNNLGWSLMKARKYQEAVTVLREAIERGNDGKYPLRNLPTALRKLGRFSEAIDVLQQDTRNGVISQRSQKLITELHGLILKHGESTHPSDASSVSDLEDEVETLVEEEEDSASEEVATDSTREVLETPRNVRSKPETTTWNDNQPPEAVCRAKMFRSKASTPVPREQTLEELLEEMILRDQEAFGRTLRVYESPDGLYGRQFAIPGVGRIDLLVQDLDTNDLIVIELKRDKSADEVVGQACRYIGWVRENLAATGQKVLGIICVHQTSEKLRLAVSALPDIDVFQYALTFEKTRNI